jgi:hypothetical protein
MGMKETNASIMPGASNVESGLPNLQPLQQVSRGDLSSSKTFTFTFFSRKIDNKNKFQQCESSNRFARSLNLIS